MTDHPAWHGAKTVVCGLATVGFSDLSVKLHAMAPAARSPLEWSPSEWATVMAAFSTACAGLVSLINCVKGLFRKPPSPPAPAPA